MRTLIVCGVVGVVLGLAWELAAQWSPRARGGEPETIVEAMRDHGMRVGDVRAGDAHASDTHARDTRMQPIAAQSLDALLAEERPDATAAGVTSSTSPEQDRITQLTSAGFTRDRALEIVQRESQLRRAQIEREYAATGTIRPLNASSPSAAEQQLRREMGDAEFERYLAAVGQTTRIRVGDVESDSPAANAGIVSGDELLEYAGRRVFNLRDLHALMLQIPDGKTVETTVLRNGQKMRLYVTGGPLGISQPGTH